MATKQHNPRKEIPAAWKFILASIIVCVVVLAGSLFYARWQHDQDLERNTYNGFYIRPNGELWIAEVLVNSQLYYVPFYYHPREVENVSVELGLADQITQAAVRPSIVYIALDPEAGSKPVIAAVELSRLFGTRYGLLNLPVQSALSRPDTNAAAQTPIITCADALDGALVVVFSLGAESRVFHEGDSCIRVEYTSADDSIRVADRFAYELLQIM